MRDIKKKTERSGRTKINRVFVLSSCSFRCIRLDAEDDPALQGTVVSCTAEDIQNLSLNPAPLLLSKPSLSTWLLWC